MCVYVRVYVRVHVCVCVCAEGNDKLLEWCKTNWGLLGLI